MQGSSFSLIAYSGYFIFRKDKNVLMNIYKRLKYKSSHDRWKSIGDKQRGVNKKNKKTKNKNKQTQKKVKYLFDV